MSTEVKRTIRTVLQAIIGFAPVLPKIVEAAGIPQSLPWVAAGLAIAAAVTRVMAIKEVQELLDKIGLGTLEQCDHPGCPRSGG